MKAILAFFAFLLGFALSQTNGFCPDGTPTVQCLVDPCSNTPPGCEGYECVADYCGGCNAKYFTAEGVPVDCRNTSRTCNVSECGMRPYALYQCPDGSFGGITGRCLYNPETNQCAWEYRTCPCPPVCLIFCEYGNVKDERGCPICRCNEPPPSCPTICPELNCTDSYTPEGGCCPECRSIDCRTVLCRRVQPCREGYEAVRLPGQCCEQCVPVDTRNEKDCKQVKCGRGQTRVRRGRCYVCEPIVNCSAVSCLQVECRPGYKKVVPEGECCPRCVLDNQCEEMQKQGYQCRTNCSEGYEPVDTGKCCPHCKRVGRCETVRCAAPNCDQRFWVHHKGSCCPSCPVCEDSEQYSCTLQGEPVCAKGYYRGRNCSEKVSDDQRKSENLILRVCSNRSRCPGYSENEIKVYVARRSNVSAENIRIHRLDVERPGCCLRYRVEIAAEKSDKFDVEKARSDIENSVQDSEFQLLPPLMTQTSAGSKLSWFGLF